MVEERKGKMMPLDIQSPILRIRMLKGLTPDEMAVVLGVEGIVVSSIEKGTALISEDSQLVLTGLGFNGPELAKEQEEFISKKREWLIKHFAEKE